MTHSKNLMVDLFVSKEDITMILLGSHSLIADAELQTIIATKNTVSAIQFLISTSQNALHIYKFENNNTL